MKLLLLSNDLMISSLVAGAAKQNNLSVVALANQAAALHAVEDSGASLLVIDLRLPGLNVNELVSTIRSGPDGTLPIIAFGPHVHEANLAAARDAGCDLVVTRGQFDRDASQLFGQLLNR